MTALLAAAAVIFSSILVALHMSQKPPTEEPTNAPVSPPEPPQAPQPPVEPPSTALDFSTPKKAYHSTRVICDEMGLSVPAKNLICACIYQESAFKNTVKYSNRDKAGNVWSTDWGIVQINDYYNIGKGKPFPSVQYVLDHPEECVRWMITMYKAGKLKLWSSYSTGAYKKWLAANSPMWALAS